MKSFYLFVVSLLFSFVGFSTVVEASRPASNKVHYSKSKDSIIAEAEIESEIKKKVVLMDSVALKTETLPQKPKKRGLGMIIGGSFLLLLGIVFGIGLLLIFLLGFSIGSGFYFRDIYAIAGIMLGGLINFGVGIYMISRGRARWRAYKKYRKAVRKMKKNNHNLK
ncbi:hypothetical protein WAF17_17685 [Bernardetia sp. ABR2-2B]|uniref:hypothetical protein n=1 Tax=Bernardetia sp. ABR2-2B TaxID=3127472 RepID=UPI0030D4C297